MPWVAGMRPPSRRVRTGESRRLARLCDRPPCDIPSLEYHAVHMRSGDKATEWLRKQSDMDLVAATKRAAEGGGVKAMEDLAKWYRNGEHGLAKDGAAAFRYAMQAADAGSLLGLAMAGGYYALGFGVEKNVGLGSSMATEAAMKGNDWACFMLGCWSVKVLPACPRTQRGP